MQETAQQKKSRLNELKGKGVLCIYTYINHTHNTHTQMDLFFQTCGAKTLEIRTTL